MTVCRCVWQKRQEGRLYGGVTVSRCFRQKRQEGRLRCQLQESQSKLASLSRFPPVTVGGARQQPPLGGGFKLAPISVPDTT